MNSETMGLAPQELLAIYRTMCTIRLFEETASELFHLGQLPGSVHLYTGQEACAAGVGAALRESDYLVSTHRGHGHLIGKGADVKGMMAEIFGRQTGLCKGKGGSLHIADFRVGIIGAMGIVGGGLPVATGAGLASKMQHDGRVVVCFFGDGASNQGTFHESLNLASLWSLPVIYVCENNQYAITTHISETMASPCVVDRAAAYCIPNFVVDGNRPLEVYRVAREAVARAREGGGPTLMECHTYRWRGHFEGEGIVFGGRTYRSEHEIEEWKAKDPIVAFRQLLLVSELVAEEQLSMLEREVRLDIEEAVQFAKDSPWPKPEEALDSVYVV